MQEIVDCISRTLGRAPRPLRAVMRDGSQVITTGDASLDELLGGGIRVGMIWEFVGEGQVLRTPLIIWLTLSPRFQRGGQDTASTTTLTPRAAPRLPRRP